MVQTITWTSEMERNIQEAVNMAENRMNAWLKENEITKEQWLGTSTDQSHFLVEGLLWHTSSITITYQTL